MEQTDFVKIRVKKEDRRALRIAAANWGLSMQDAFTKLVYGINEANDAGLLRAGRPKIDAAREGEVKHNLAVFEAMLSEGGEDVGA